MIESLNLHLGDFKTDDERAQAVVELKQLMATPGWKFIYRVLRENLALVEDVIFDPATPEDERKPRLTARIYLKSLMNLPAEQIAKFGGTPPIEQNPDPFHTVDTIHQPPTG